MTRRTRQINNYKPRFNIFCQLLIEEVDRKISNNTEDLKQTINQFGIIENYRRLHPTEIELFSSAQKHLPRETIT